MTEPEWLAATDPEPMLAVLETYGRASDRKVRLATVACLRLQFGESQAEILDTVERYADGSVTLAELHECFDYRDLLTGSAWALLAAAPPLLARATAPLVSHAASQAASRETAHTAVTAVREAASAVQCRIFRDIFGNPFQPAADVDPNWLAWNHDTVGRLAESAYKERELPSGLLFSSRLAFLADALEDAGCTDAELLGHLRGPGTHVRGCWALDLPLEKK
jgi:hypothetical protein